MIYKETSKLYAYCISGSIESLEIIFKILKSKFDEKPTRIALMTQILQWTSVADTLVFISPASE
jgi:hypothetical protein